METVAQGDLGVAVKEAVDEHPLPPLLLDMALGQHHMLRVELDVIWLVPRMVCDFNGLDEIEVRKAQLEGFCCRHCFHFCRTISVGKQYEQYI